MARVGVPWTGLVGAWVNHAVVGCGKTTLVSRIIDELHKREEIHLLYFYISATDLLLKDRKTLLRTFAKQIIRRNHEAVQTPTQITKDHQFESEIQASLFRYLRHEAKSSVYIVVDAVDEYDRNNRDWLIDTLIGEYQPDSSLSRFKILISSRDTIGIKKIRTVDKQTKVHTIEIGLRDNVDDIRYFVRSKLEKLRIENPLYDVNWQEEVLENLTEHANGMFLWVSLQMKMITETAPINILNYVNGLALPKGMQDVYKDIMEKFSKAPNERIIARKTLTLLIHATRPIAVDALLEAVAMDTTKNGLDTDFLDGLKRSPKEIIRICRYLVVMDEDPRVFRFTHSSVYEYLTTGDQPHQRLALEKTSDHALLAEICLSYLCCDRFSEGPRSYLALYDPSPLKTCLGDNPLLEFASTQWACHTRSSMSESLNRLLELCQKVQNMLLAFQVFLFSRHVVMATGVRSTHIISYFGLFDFLDVLDREGLLEKDAQAGNGFTAMHWAIDGQQGSVLDTVKKLITYKADINAQDDKGRTPLYHAAHQEDLDVVTELLQTKNVKVDCHRKALGTALIVASYKGHADIVRKLIKARADATIMSDFGTALHAAASQGSKECVSIILESKSAGSLDVVGPHIGTPLHEAAFYGQHEIVQMLLENRFDVKKMSRDYGNPLQAASAGCFQGMDSTDFKEIFRILFQFNVDVNAQGGRFTTALHVAAQYGHLDLAEMLINKGANVDIKGPNGTAFQEAGRGRHTDIMDLLAKCGASTAPEPSDHASEADSRNNYASGRDTVRRPKGLFRIFEPPLWMFRNALKANEEKRMEIFFSSYTCGIEHAIKMHQDGFLEMLVSVGEQVFKDVISLTTPRDDSQAGESVMDTHSSINVLRSLTQALLDIFIRIFNKVRRSQASKKVKTRRKVSRVARLRTDAFPFYSTNPAFKTLDRLTQMAVSILAYAMERENVAAVELISKTWTEALYKVQDDLGDEMLRVLIDARAKELQACLAENKMEAAKRLARVGVQLLATAVGQGAHYKPLVHSLARLWTFAMRDVDRLGEDTRDDCLSQLLGTVIQDFEVGLRKGDDAKIEQFTQATIEVFGQIITEGLDGLFDVMARICVTMWNAVIMYHKEQLINGVLEGRAEELVRLGEFAGVDMRIFHAGYSFETEGVTQKLSDIIIKVLQSALASNRRDFS